MTTSSSQQPQSIGKSLTQFIQKYQIIVVIVLATLFLSVLSLVTRGSQSTVPVSNFGDSSSTVSPAPTATPVPATPTQVPVTQRPTRVPITATPVVTQVPSPQPTSSCIKPDEALKSKWEEGQKELDKVNAELSAEVKEMNAMDNPSPSNPEYKAKSDAHDVKLKASYSLSSEVYSAKNTYNKQVEAYNACIK